MNLLNRDISDYYTLPFSQMYYDLKALRKTDFSPDTTILVKSNGDTDQHIWKHFLKIVKFLDIPIYFINIETNSKELEKLLSSLIKKIIPWEDNIKINYQQASKVKFPKPINSYDIPDTICLYPFTGLNVGFTHSVSACCAITKNYEDTDGNEFNVNEHTLDHAFNSGSAKDLRAKFLRGEKPSACEPCWLPEKAGRPSMRTMAKNIENFGELELTTNFRGRNLEVNTLSLILNSTCNSKCRICSPVKSTAWYKEIKQHFSDPLPSEILRTTWLTSEDSIFWNNIKTTLPGLTFVSFAGGEPFLDPHHKKLLKLLIDEGKTDTVIHYNTNGTIYPDSAFLDMLSKFQKVVLSFSIDNVTDRFNYERFGTVSWKTVIKNLKKFSKLDREQFSLDFHSTLSVFNILDADKVKNLADDLDRDIYFGLVKSPKYFSFLNIPHKGRKYIIKKLKNSVHEIIREMAIQLDTDEYHDLNEEFWTEINRIDRVRNQCFADTYPEMNKIMLISQ